MAVLGASRSLAGAQGTISTSCGENPDMHNGGRVRPGCRPEISYLSRIERVRCVLWTHLPRRRVRRYIGMHGYITQEFKEVIAVSVLLQ